MADSSSIWPARAFPHHFASSVTAQERAPPAGLPSAPLPLLLCHHGHVGSGPATLLWWSRYGDHGHVIFQSRCLAWEGRGRARAPFASPSSDIQDALRSALSSGPNDQTGSADGSDMGIESAPESLRRGRRQVPCVGPVPSPWETVSLRRGLVLTGYCHQRFRLALVKRRNEFLRSLTASYLVSSSITPPPPDDTVAHKLGARLSLLLIDSPCLESASVYAFSYIFFCGYLGSFHFYILCSNPFISLALFIL